MIDENNNEANDLKQTNQSGSQQNSGSEAPNENQTNSGQPNPPNGADPNSDQGSDKDVEGAGTVDEQLGKESEQAAQESSNTTEQVAEQLKHYPFPDDEETKALSDAIKEHDFYKFKVLKKVLFLHEQNEEGIPKKRYLAARVGKIARVEYLLPAQEGDEQQKKVVKVDMSDFMVEDSNKIVHIMANKKFCDNFAFC